MRDVVYHVPDYDSPEEKRQFLIRLGPPERCVVDSHASLDDTDNVELDEAEEESGRLEKHCATLLFLFLSLFLLG